jgi:hypothetical protein
MCYASHGDSRPIYASFMKDKNGKEDDIVLHGQKNSEGQNPVLDDKDAK